MQKAEAKYKAIFEALKVEILGGKYSATRKLPSETQLMRRFGVSRNTVRNALEELKRTGVLETRNGSGTYLSAAASRPVGTLGMIVPGSRNTNTEPAAAAKYSAVRIPLFVMNAASSRAAVRASEIHAIVVCAL